MYSSYGTALLLLNQRVLFPSMLFDENSTTKYNVFKEHDLELSKLTELNITSSFIKEHEKDSNLPKRRIFSFIVSTQLNFKTTFTITIIKKKFPNIYYGYDSTAFCLIKSQFTLKNNKRYQIYGSLTKNKLFFLDAIKADLLDYKVLLYNILNLR